MRCLLAGALLILAQYPSQFAEYAAQHNSRIRGTVMNSNGQPAQNMLVGLEHVEDGRMEFTTWTDSKGRYDFPRSAAGDYFLVVNPLGPSPTRPYPIVFYPGTESAVTAATIHLARSAVLDDYNFILPTAWRPVIVETTVIFPDGSPPPAGVYVSAHDVDYLGSAEPANADTDGDGKAELTVYEGRSYYLDATITEGTHQRCAGPLKFTARDGLVLDTITIEHDWGNCLAQLSPNFELPP